MHVATCVPIPSDADPEMARVSDCNSFARAVVQVSDYTGFLVLHDAWNGLVANHSLFLRHEWFDAAWQWRGRDDAVRLTVLCVFRGKDLVGILPLIARTERAAGMARRVLEFPTVPDSQSCDIIAAEPERAAVADALAAELSARRGEWDVLRLSYLPEHALARSEFARALEAHGIEYQTTGTGGNSYISLETGWDDYYSTRSRRLKKASNLNANRLKKAGEIRIDWLKPGIAAPAEVRPALETAIAISANSWKRSTGNSLDNPGPQAFIRRISELAVQQGWLSLWVLALNGRPMAMEYQLVFNGKVHALRADFVDGCENISPGSHLNRHQLEQLFGRGLHRYLMGPGDNPYKKHWTEQAEPLFQLDAYSTSARGRLTALWDLKLKPELRALKARVFRDKRAEAQ